MGKKKEDNKNNMFWYFFGLAVFVLIVLVPSCDMKYCFIAHSTENSFEAEYRYFSGVEEKRVYLNEDESVVIEYDSVVEKGELTISVKSPAGGIIAEIEGGTTGAETIIADTRGEYRFIIEGEKTRGSYSMEWQKRF